MGASIAYEIALEMERNAVPPTGLFVSAHPPPHRQRRGMLYCASDEVLLDDVRRLSGDKAGLFEHPEVRVLFLPTLRADYRLIETYHPDILARLTCRIEVVLPLGDSEITNDEAWAWQDLCRSPLVVHEIEGDHFYLEHKPQDLIALLGSRLQER